MSLLVIAYPDLNRHGFDLIESFRQRNDHLSFKKVRPHFTLVFPVEEFPQEEFITEIKNQASPIKPIEFTVHHASHYQDSLDELHRVFLVPEKGYDELEALHDRLYSGKL